MKKIITTLLLASACAFAQSEEKQISKPHSPLTQKTALDQCNKAADSRKGDERKAFIKQCVDEKLQVKKLPPPVHKEPVHPSKEVMAACEKQAGTHKGPERVQFIKACVNENGKPGKDITPPTKKPTVCDGPLKMKDPACMKK